MKKTCKNCNLRSTCTVICEDIKHILPSDNKGKLRNEISLSNSDGFEEKLGVAVNCKWHTNSNKFNIKFILTILTDEQFKVFNLKLEGAGWWDITNELGITEQAAKERFRKAINKIRQHTNSAIV